MPCSLTRGRFSHAPPPCASSNCPPLLRFQDEGPLAEMRAALLSAQDDLQSKAEEANGLASKVARLEYALSQLV